MADRQVSARPFIKRASIIFLVSCCLAAVALFFGQPVREWLGRERTATDEEVYAAIGPFVFTALAAVLVCGTLLTSVDHWQRLVGLKTYPFQGWFLVIFIAALSIILLWFVAAAVFFSEYPPPPGDTSQNSIQPPKAGERPGITPAKRKTLSEHVQFMNTFLTLVLCFILLTQFFTLRQSSEKKSRHVDAMEETDRT